MKGKLALGGGSGGTGRFNAKFMRTLSLQPSGSSGGTWQVCPCLHPLPILGICMLRRRCGLVQLQSHTTDIAY